MSNSIFTPFFRTIDRVIFGIEDIQEKEDYHPEFKEWLIERKPEEQEDRVVVRSVN